MRMTEKTIESFLKIVEYREDGHFYLTEDYRKKKAGDRAGSLDKRLGYWVVYHKGQKMHTHRLGWFVAYGEWPEMVDHINGDRADNRLCNLRAATRRENTLNSKVYRTNTSGQAGVRKKLTKKNEVRWEVRVQVAKRVRKTLGVFKCFELACLVAEEGRKKYHGEFYSAR